MTNLTAHPFRVASHEQRGCRNMVEVNERTLDWLDEAIDLGQSYQYMADHLGCCTDTLKRILHRHGLVEFEGAKYQSLTINPGPQWERPCMRCKSDEARPKYQYFCTPCTERNKRMASQSHEDWTMTAPT